MSAPLAWLVILLLVLVCAGGVASPFLRRSARARGALEVPEDPQRRHVTPPRRERAAPIASAGRRWVTVTIAGVAVSTAVIVTLLGLERGETSTPLQPRGSPLAFFESRVRDDPGDVVARLDLAHRYLDAGRADEAVEHYLVALELEPEDPEAHAHLGLLQYLGGHPERGLSFVERALQVSPSYPEGLFIKGVILDEGLDRPDQAAAALRAYLEAAPFGSERETAKHLIRKAESAPSGEVGT